MASWSVEPEGKKRSVPWDDQKTSPKIRRNLENSFTEAKNKEDNLSTLAKAIFDTTLRKIVENLGPMASIGGQKNLCEKLEFLVELGFQSCPLGLIKNLGLLCGDILSEFEMGDVLLSTKVAHLVARANVRDETLIDELMDMLDDMAVTSKLKLEEYKQYAQLVFDGGVLKVLVFFALFISILRKYFKGNESVISSNSEQSNAGQIQVLTADVVVLAKKLEGLTELVTSLAGVAKPSILLKEELNGAKSVSRSNREKLPKILQLIADNLQGDFGENYVWIWHFCVPEVLLNRFEGSIEEQVVDSADFLIEVLLR